MNCALLGISWARAQLVSTGAAKTKDWRAQEMKDGEIKTAYAGGCLSAGDPNMDGQLEALVLGATIELTNPFTAARTVTR